MTFKQILESAHKNLATDIYLTPDQPIYIRTRGAIKILPQKNTLSEEKISQLVDKLTEKKDNLIETEGSIKTIYKVKNINKFKVHIYEQQAGQTVHLQVISNDTPNSKSLNTDFLDGYSTIKDGLVLFSGGHQSGLSHTLNSLVYVTSFKQEKLLGVIAKTFPWDHKNHNSLIFNFKFKDNLQQCVEQALTSNCDYLFIDDMNWHEFKELKNYYSFDRPTYITLNSASLVHTLKKLKTTDYYLQLKNHLRIVTHQNIIFSHKIAKNYPVFESVTGTSKVLNSIEDETLLSTISSLSDLDKKHRDEHIITKEKYLALAVRRNMMSSQQASQICQDPNTLMKMVASMDDLDKTNVIDTTSLVSAPAIRLDKEWTSIENLPIEDED